MPNNQLYLAVLPLIHLGDDFGQTEQVLTLLAGRDLATQFLPDEVKSYITTFKNREKYLIGGNVTGYDIEEEPTEDGCVIVRVTQHVA